MPLRKKYKTLPPQTTKPTNPAYYKTLLMNEKGFILERVPMICYHVP